MLIFSSSDKGGTGRSVTSCNLAYRLSLLGQDVAYLDFDFGSPTAGAIFEIPTLERGTRNGGLHSYIRGRATEPVRADIRTTTERQVLKERPPGSGKLTLFPGDVGGAEFSLTNEHIKKAAELFQTVEREFDVCIVDLSAGRSSALDMSLQAISPKNRPKKAEAVRWLLFHRWTTQHVIAASGLLLEENGILSCALAAGFARREFLRLVRTIRTAVPDASAFGKKTTAEQDAWLSRSDDILKTLAKSRGLGLDMLAGTTPLEPMLLWREQVIMDVDVKRRLADKATTQAFEELANKLIDDEAWEGFER
ncbi:ParA family protein [Catenulispora sp. NF23]|uniref:ParA family protein n=1 Tax=Catenulispora pinistramenti TaxID=2705254 RepID=A0ABS5KNL7_9ACTN|nr:SCO2523 family variant P-loop protein [Catenulispora pinistramenti]MBS2531801.1 ParA family protein [Catenulispora pinistramenti]MBS2547653.1 ParA family protein [Catenulispora pinistramenti]